MRRSADFSAVIRDGRRAASPTVVLHLLGLESTEPTRVGFVVSRGVGNAVVRNQVKRRLRHVCQALVATPGMALVVRATPAAAQAGSQRLEADLSQCVRKARASA